MPDTARTTAEAAASCASGARICVGAHLQRVEPGPLHLGRDPIPDDAVEAFVAASVAPDATGNGHAPEGEKKKDEGVIDAEYVDVDDKK